MKFLRLSAFDLKYVFYDNVNALDTIGAIFAVRNLPGDAIWNKSRLLVASKPHFEAVGPVIQDY